MKPETHVFTANEFFPYKTPIVVNWGKHNPQEYPPGSYLLNQREFWKIFYVISGAASLKINGKIRPVGPGFIGLCHPDDLTTFEVTADLQIFNVLFLPQVIQTDLPRLSNENGFFSIFQQGFHPNDSLNHEMLHLFDANRKILQHIRKMYREYETKYFNFEEMLHAELVELLIELARLSERKYPRQRRREVARQIDRYLEQHYFEPLNISQLADHLEYSRGHLQQLYHQQAGRTIGQALLAFRLQKFTERLCSSAEPITRLCYQCGFRDLANFYRTFRKLTGQTPRQYRSAKNIP